MDLLQALRPIRALKDCGVSIRVKVSMPSVLILPEEDAGNLPIRPLVQMAAQDGKPQAAKAQFTPQT